MLFAVIMAGGRGERFWPMSRRTSPKQSLNFVGGRTMIQATYDRIHPLVPDKNILVVTGKEHASLMRRQIPQLKRKNIIIEPEGKNTAACIGLAALHIQRKDPDAVMTVFPADHLIKDSKKFLNSVEMAIRVARKSNALVTFGIKPQYPSTGYGYIKGLQTSRFKVDNFRLYRIERFAEKPGRKAAMRMVKSGKYFWNSGIFVWRTSAILEAIKEEMPRLHSSLQKIKKVLGTGSESEVVQRMYAKLKAVSIDRGVLEKVDNGCLLEANFDWSDIGSWASIRTIQPVDASRNVIVGKASCLETRDCIIVSDRKHLVGAVGVTGLIIVHTPDATLICPRDHAEDVKALVMEISKNRRNRQYL